MPLQLEICMHKKATALPKKLNKSQLESCSGQPKLLAQELQNGHEHQEGLPVPAVPGGGRTRLPWPEHLHTSDEAQARDLLPCLFQRLCLIPDIPCPRQLHVHLFNVSRYIPPVPNRRQQYQSGSGATGNLQTTKHTNKPRGSQANCSLEDAWI